jgi:hypothetical protein
VAPDELIGTAEAARILGVTQTHVHYLIRRYQLLTPAGETPRAILLRRTDVERLAREGWPGRRHQRAQ